MYKNIQTNNDQIYKYENIVNYNVLEPITLDNEYEKQINLFGKMSTVAVAVRASKSGLRRYDFSDVDSVQILDHNRTPIISSNNVEQNNTIRSIWDRSDNRLMDKYTNLYYFRFGDPGDRSGCYQFTGREFIKIYQSTAKNTTGETSEVQLLTGSAAATSGYFQISFNGCQTVGLAYNASSADILTALTDLQSVRECENIKLSCTSALTTTGLLTIGISNLHSFYKKYKESSPSAKGFNFSVSSSSLLATATLITFVHSCSVSGIARKGLGSTSGANYYIDVWGVKESIVKIPKNGGKIVVNE
jgi:hypothetical protein